jgi:DNA topoisomerase-3
MSKILVLAEKPSVAQDVAKVLNCKTRGDGFIEGNGFIVTWAVGHLAQLCDPEELDEKYKAWSFDVLPIIPERFRLKPNPSTTKQFNIVKRLMNSNEVDKWILATDAGREGELIGRYCQMLANCKKPFQRLWISSMTDKAIKEGFANLKPSKDYDNLYLSAKCRSESDWLVGMNGTRAFTIKYKPMIGSGSLSVGRVQTPTLAIMVNRHHEIANFKPQDYWTIRNHYDKFSALWFDETSKESRIFDKARAEAISNKLNGKTATVKDIKNENKKDVHPQLFDLTELQRMCNRRLSLSAAKTLETVQSLYEKKVVTYPRTDSKYISDDIVPTLMDRIKAVDFGPFSVFIGEIKKKPINPGKRVVDNSKVSDHHAIIPTEQKADLGNLTDIEKKVYDIIVRRFLSIFLPPFEYMITSIITNAENELFMTKGRTIINLGWMALYKSDKSKSDDEDGEKEDKEEQELPKCNIGDTFKINKVETKKEATKPTSPYNEDTLLNAMEHAGKFVEDKELSEQLKDGGIGTPATRSNIIERLITQKYITREKKYLIPTDKGIKLIEIVPNELKSPELTGKWEKALNMMAKGQYPVQRFMESIQNYSKFLVEEAKKDRNVTFESSSKGSSSSSGGGSKESVGQCKECGADIVETTKGFSCSKWRDGCKFTLWKNDKILSKYGKTMTKTVAKALLKSDKATVKGCTDPTSKEKVDIEFFLVKEGVYWNVKDRNGSSSNTQNTQTNTTNTSSTPKVNQETISDKKSYSCPACKQGTMAYKATDKFTGWGCNRWKEGCSFGIPAESGGVSLEIYINQLQEKGETDIITFKSPKGPYKAKLKVKGNKLEREFINDK